MVKPSGDAKWDSAVEATYAANDHTFALPANPAGEEFRTAWQDAVNRVLNGQQDPEEAMAQAQDEAQKALDTAWDKWESQ
jgi:multiple sugar transport system substrate-binding protein